MREKRSNGMKKNENFEIFELGPGKTGAIRVTLTVFSIEFLNDHGY